MTNIARVSMSRYRGNGEPSTMSERMIKVVLIRKNEQVAVDT